VIARVGARVQLGTHEDTLWRTETGAVNQVVENDEGGSIARYCSIMNAQVMVHLIRFIAAYCTSVLECREQR